MSERSVRPQEQVAEMVGLVVFARVMWPGERPYYAQVAGELVRDAAGTYQVEAPGASTAYDAADGPTALPAIITFAAEDVGDVFYGKPWEAPVIIIRPQSG